MTKIIKPKGLLIPMGGAVDKSKKKTIMCRLLEETQKKKPKVCIITLASSTPEEEAENYRDCFNSIKQTDFSQVHYIAREAADDVKMLENIRKANIIIFSGGDQLRLTSLLGGTALLELVKSRYYDDSELIVAGSSAGAAAMSNTMIVAGNSEDSMIKGELELTNGLNFISNVFIDTHFTERGRIGRLIQTVTHNPGILGLGLGENTAAIIRKGEQVEVVGSGLMVVVDGTSITYTNLAEIEHDTPVTVENVSVSAIGHGKKYSIARRRLM